MFSENNIMLKYSSNIQYRIYKLRTVELSWTSVYIHIK